MSAGSTRPMYISPSLVRAPWFPFMEPPLPHSLSPWSLGEINSNSISRRLISVLYPLIAGIGSEVAMWPSPEQLELMNISFGSFAGTS